MGRFRQEKHGNSTGKRLDLNQKKVRIKVRCGKLCSLPNKHWDTANKIGSLHVKDYPNSWVSQHCFEETVELLKKNRGFGILLIE